MTSPAYDVGTATSDGRELGHRFLTVRHAARLRRTQIGLGIAAAIVAIAVFGPLAAPHSPTEFVGQPYAKPGASALLGTDYLGRDVLTRFLWGGRSVIVLALLATALGLFSGIAIGLVAAYSRRWMDELSMRAMDVLLSFPQVVFVLLLVSSLGPKLWLVVAAIGVTHAPRVARVTRAATLEVVGRHFVEAAEARGERRTRILAAEILPNLTSPLLVEFGLRLTFSIALVAAVSFLGFGLQPPAADWGLMINENRVGLGIQPYPVVIPIAAIALLTVGTNLVADGFARVSIGIGRRSAGTS